MDRKLRYTFYHVENKSKVSIQSEQEGLTLTDMSKAGDLSSLAWKHMPCSHFLTAHFIGVDLIFILGKDTYTFS